MPEIEIQHVVSCSSADKNNPAENLLKSDGTHKWKSATAGEKNVSCVLQLNKSSQIHSIDIGNEGSAFVEVLVGKATAAADQDFEVLLVASAFMSPLESRNGSNRNAVRMFGPDKLNKTTACQKWDRVKVVCTQPFSKLSAYGLSFIKFHSPPGAGDGETKVKKLGAFTIKDDGDDDDDDIQVGTLFAKRSQRDPSPPPVPKGAAAVRAASRLAEEHIKASPAASTTPSASTTAAKKRQASSPPPSTSKTKTAKKDDSDTEEENEELTPAKPNLKRQSTSLSSVASSTATSTRGEKSALKRTKTEPTTPSPAKAFGKLMEGVVFVLSGFQNPYRGELRDQAMEMGAKYRPDWGRGCTHLICAFTNTPKYQQVSGKGKIVTKAWILDCYKQKKLLPWRKYRLGNAESPDESSEDEEEERRPRRTPSKRKSPPPSTKTPSKQSQNTSKKGVSFGDDSDSAGDTDEELRKAEERAKKTKAQGNSPTKAKSPPRKPEADDPYGGSTDEDEATPSDTKNAGNTTTAKDDGSDSGLPDLPEFFTDKHFFFYGDFEDAQQRLLTRYIAAYNGEVEDYMNKRVNYVITAQKWDDNFDDALSENPSLVFVKPKWIFACHEKNKLLPYQHYVVVP